MIKLMFFGQLADITGSQTLELDSISDTESLQQKVNARFPAMAGITYRIAVNKKVVTQNVSLEKDATVALLPPFSGG